MRQWKILPYNILYRQPCACMALAYTGMTRITLSPQHPSPNDTMTNIWFRSKTTNAGSIATKYANVMKHGCLFNKAAVEMKLRMGITYFKRPPRY